MKRKAQFVFAGYGGKTVYVQGFLTDENDLSPGQLKFEVVSSAPEPRPIPGLYGSKDLPGGWIMLVPEKDVSQEQDEVLLKAAAGAGFTFLTAP